MLLYLGEVQAASKRLQTATGEDKPIGINSSEEIDGWVETESKAAVVRFHVYSLPYEPGESFMSLSFT